MAMPIWTDLHGILMVKEQNLIVQIDMCFCAIKLDSSLVSAPTGMFPQIILVNSNTKNVQFQWTDKPYLPFR